MGPQVKGRSPGKALRFLKCENIPACAFAHKNHAALTNSLPPPTLPRDPRHPSGLDRKALGQTGWLAGFILCRLWPTSLAPANPFVPVISDYLTTSNPASCFISALDVIIPTSSSWFPSFPSSTGYGCTSLFFFFFGSSVERGLISSWFIK